MTPTQVGSAESLVLAVIPMAALISLILFLNTAEVAGDDASHQRSCGQASLLDLCHMLDQELSADQVRRLEQAYPELEVSMFDLQQAAESLGLALMGIQAELRELSTLRGPKIIRLADPPHFVVLAQMTDDQAQLLDGGRLVVLPIGDLAVRYARQALIIADKIQGGPRLALNHFDFSFGVAGLGQEIRHVFEIRNMGDTDLILSAPFCRSCGGPRVALSSEVIPPGGGAELLMEFSINHCGDTLQTTRLLSNDPLAPVSILSARGRVPHTVTIMPDRLRAVLPKGAELRRELRLTGPAEMQVTKAESHSASLAVTVAASAHHAEGASSWDIAVTCPASQAVGELSDRLMIKTTDAERPEVVVPITILREADLVVSPPTAFLGLLKPGQPIEKRVTVRSRSGRAFRLAPLESIPTGIAASITPGPDGQWFVTIRVRARVKGLIERCLVLGTDVPGEERIEVPVYAHVVD